MPLPQKLIDGLLENYGYKELIKHHQNLSTGYREGKWRLTQAEKLCYAIARMPATYAVISHLTTSLEFKTILDVGAGPGTASFALEGQVTALEHDVDFIDLGKKLGSPAIWIACDAKTWKSENCFDLVLFSYSYGEMAGLKLANYWKSCARYMLIIEPGTPRGWQNILRAREELIDLGGYIWAPCPHHTPCPLVAPDWCHFGIKLPRSELHQRLKQGTLNYEEEKFSYLLVGKTPRPSQARVLRPPQKRSGHVILKLCTTEGLQQVTVSKKDPEYANAKEVRWGSELKWQL